MKFTRRGFFKRLVGISALVAVPSLGLAKQIAEKMVIDRDVDHMYQTKFNHGKIEREVDRSYMVEEWVIDPHTFQRVKRVRTC